MSAAFHYLSIIRNISAVNSFFRFIYGVDYYGNVCGTNNTAVGRVPANKSMDFTDKKYLYFMLDTQSIDGRNRGYIGITRVN